MKLQVLSRVLLLSSQVLLTSAISAIAEEHCLIRYESLVSIKRFDVPATVPGLEPQIIMPSEGKLQFFLENDAKYGHDAWSPTGDITPAVGPYDPKSGRLYVWGYFDIGWIKVIDQSGNWLFGESAKISPRLFDSWNDGKGDSVKEILRSPVLDVLFYQGTTAKHWLTKRQSYRVYQIDGSEMKRVPDLETRKLRYIGDDPIAKMAVFAPVDVEWSDRQHRFVWYNGESVIEPPSEEEIPHTFCY